MENITIEEIENQFITWRKLDDVIKDNEEYINKCLKFIDENTLVVFTGAGTSGYVGDTLIEYLNEGQKSIKFLSYYSTNIVGNPELCFNNKKVLLVSFARSGNSPESCEAIELANKYSTKCMHLIISCNESGSLCVNNKEQCIILPKETNDKGFAMTNSFTSMLIIAAKIFGLSIDTKQLIDESSKIYNNFPYEKVLDFDFENVVYLANSENVGLLNELKLKMIELTGGIFGYYSDQFLNFRHGPKSVLAKRSLIFYLTSTDNVTNKYEHDLINEINNDDNDVLTVNFGIENSNANINCPLDTNGLTRALCVVPCLQKIAVNKSIKEGINPDNPSPSGAVNRVVQGVNIHERKSC